MHLRNYLYRYNQKVYLKIISFVFLSLIVIPFIARLINLQKEIEIGFCLKYVYLSGKSFWTIIDLYNFF